MKQKFIDNKINLLFIVSLLQNHFSKRVDINFRELQALVAQSCLTLRSHGLESTRFLCLWDSPGKNTGVGCHFLIHSAKSLQLCPTLCDPRDGSPQAPPSLGFSRQEHWSGLPFPSPMHESEKWKWSRSVMSNSSRPHGLQPSRLLRPWEFPGKSTGVGCHCLLRPYPLENCKTGIKHFIRNMLIPMRNRKSMGYAQNFIQGQRKIG